MPAKKRNESRYKPFLGRVFTLRQHKNFPCYYKNKERIQIDPKEIGEAVLVFDETNTRVKISLANGSFVWVPKFYLHKEITNESFRKSDDIAYCVESLLKISSVLKNEEIISSATRRKICKKIENVSKVLRFWADDADPRYLNKEVSNGETEKS